VLDFLEKVNLLEYLALTEIVLHVILFDCLYGHLLSCELVHSQSNFTESTFSNKLYELVEVQCCRRQLVILLNVLFYVFYKLISFLQNSIIDFGRWLRSS
jgi:hypothetical protein